MPDLRDFALRSVLFTLAACGPVSGSGAPTSGTGGTTEAPAATTSTSGIVLTGEAEGGAPTTVASTTVASIGTSSSEGAEFIVTPDVPGGRECDPNAEMPCPEWQKCSAAATGLALIYLGTPACFPILGDLQKGEPCELGEDPDDGLDECASGLICVDIQWLWGTTGVCVDFCDPAIIDGEHQACADPTEFCYTPGCQECQLSLCVPACDPLVQDCPDGTGCLLAEYDSFSCQALILDVPEAGEECGSYQCAPGSQCVAGDQTSDPACIGFEVCCSPLCDLNAGNTCPGAALGDVCEPYFPEPFDPKLDPWGVQYARLGICGVAG